MHLSEINIYPIKSLGGIALAESVVERRGLQYDRRWMLVDGLNRFITQREFPLMASISVAVTADALIAKHGGSAITMPLRPGSRKAFVQIWDSQVEALEYGDDVNRWFTEAIGTKCRLIAMPESAKRTVDSKYALRRDEDTVSFADGYPYLLTNEASLANLNSRLETPVPMNRFRPNLVVSGAEPYAEDSWSMIRIGGTTFHLVKPCVRCVITTIDQTRGESSGKEPLRTLAAYRSVGGKVMFGQNLIAENPGNVIRIGDVVDIVG